MMQDFQPSFERFITLINKQEARDLVRNINLFMKNFRMKEVDSESDSKAVQDFLAYMAYTAFPRHPLWAGSSPEDLESAIEGLEKYLLTKLFDRTFGVDALDRERDLAIGLRLQALQFIRPEHLEIAHEFANDAALLLAQKELAKINMFKSPRDKLACILSCCRVISNLLASKKYGAGADDFTPVLIYVTIKAHPDALASNLAFIERFRMASRLVSEVSYMFVQMQSAVAFVEMLDVRTSLKVDQDELIAHMLAAGAFTDADLAMLQQPEPRGGSVSALQSQSSEAAAIALVEAAEARAAANAAGKGAGAKQPTDLIDFDSGPEPHVQPNANGDAWSNSAASTATEGHTHSSASGQPPQPPKNPGHSRAGSQSDAWRSHAPQHSRTPSTTFANLLDSEMPNPLLWNDPFQQHQLNQQQRPHPVQLPPHPYPPHPLPPVHPPMYAPSVPQPPYYAPTAPQQPPVWRSGSVGYSPGPHAHPPPPPPPPVPLPPSLPGGPNGTFPFAPAPAYVPPPPPPPPPVPPPPPHLPTSLADPSAITRTASIPTAQGTRTNVPAGSMRASSSAAELEEHGVQLLLAADAAGELQERYPLFHASVDALTLADVKRLLDQYKELVIKYECLARAVEEPHRTALALSQHPALPSTGTSFRDPASTFFATSTGVPLSLASTAQSTAASAAHPPPPPPPPANNAQQQQIQQQFQQASTSLAETRHSSGASQDAPAREHSPAGALHKQEAVPKAHEHHGSQQRQQQQQQQEHHQQQQQQQQQRTGGAETLGQPEGQLPQPSNGPKNEGKQSTQPWEQQPLLPGAPQNREHSTVSQVQHSQPAAPQPQEQQSPALEDDVSQHLQQKEELGLKSRGHQPQLAGAQQGMGPGPSSEQPKEELQTADDHSRQPLKDELEQEEEPQAQHQTASTQEQEGPQEQHQTAGAQEQKEPQAVDTQEQEPQAQHQYAGSQEQNEPQAQKQEEPEAQHQTAGTQEHEVPIGQAEGHQQQLAAAQQQAQHSPGQSENEHGQLAAAQQGACLPGEEDHTKSQTESTQAQDASQQACTVAWERSKMQQPPSLGSTQVIDVPPMTQTQSAQAQDAAQQAPSTVASERSTMQQPPSLGSTQVIDVPLMTQTESVQARDAAQQAPSAVASEPSTVQQDPVLGSSLVIDVPEMEQSIRNEAEEDGMQWRRCALYSMAPQAENSMRAERGEVGSRSIGETEAKSMVRGDEDGSARGLSVLATSTQGEKKEQEQEQEQEQQQHQQQQGQDGDLLGGDVAFEQPCPFNSTQGSTFAGSSTVDAIIGQGVEHWMLGSMTQEGSNDAAGASARSAELGS